MVESNKYSVESVAKVAPSPINPYESFVNDINKNNKGQYIEKKQEMNNNKYNNPLKPIHEVSNFNLSFDDENQGQEK